MHSLAACSLLVLGVCYARTMREHRLSSEPLLQTRNHDLSVSNNVKLLVREDIAVSVTSEQFYHSMTSPGLG